jgi:hypothetical protein
LRRCPFLKGRNAFSVVVEPSVKGRHVYQRGRHVGTCGRHVCYSRVQRILMS